MSQLTDGISSKESVLSTWTEAKGTSIQGDISLGLFDKSSTISEAVGLFVAVMFQHVFNKVSNCGLIPEGIVKVCPAFTCSITWLLLRPKWKDKKDKNKNDELVIERNNWHLPTGKMCFINLNPFSHIKKDKNKDSELVIEQNSWHLPTGKNSPSYKNVCKRQ
jgi:hypothetical protein